jgi:excisionase family DNA binding protein
MSYSKRRLTYASAATNEPHFPANLIRWPFCAAHGQLPREVLSAQRSNERHHHINQLRPRLTREDVLDGRDVAELLHMPISTVLEYARRGLLPGHKLGRRWIFLRDEVEAAVRGRSGDEGKA